MNNDTHAAAEQDDTARFHELGSQVIEASELYQRGSVELQLLAKKKATGLLFALGEQVQGGAFEAEGLIQALDMIAEETAALLPDEVQPGFRSLFQQVERAFLASWACAPVEESDGL